VRGLRPIGKLARGNVTRNPRRTASTAGALMIGMALVAAASVLATSTQASTASIVAEEFTGDLVVQSATFEVPAEVPVAMAEVEGVASVDVLAYGQVQVESPDGTVERTSALGLEPVIFDRSVDVTVVSGELAALDRGELVVQ